MKTDFNEIFASIKRSFDEVKALNNDIDTFELGLLAPEFPGYVVVVSLQELAPDNTPEPIDEGPETLQ